MDSSKKCDNPGAATPRFIRQHAGLEKGAIIFKSGYNPCEIGKTRIIRTLDLTKIYQVGKMAVPALNGVTLTIGRGDFVAIMGPSGSRKSTFMNILGCLDLITSGQHLLDGINVNMFPRMNWRRSGT